MKEVKNDPDALTRHHRKPKHLGGASGDMSGNISFVKRKFHEAYHLLFNHKTAPEIAEELNKDWTDPAYRMVAMTYEENERHKQINVLGDLHHIVVMNGKEFDEYSDFIAEKKKGDNHYV